MQNKSSFKDSLNGNKTKRHAEFISASHLISNSQSGGILKQVQDDSILCNNTKAFTLIELLVVVLIIGILAAVALPQYEKAVEKSRMTEGISLTSALGKAEERYFLANNTYTADFDALDLSVTGTITPYSGDVPGVQTKYFLCRAADPDSVVGRPDILAACNRMPFATFYAIIYLSDGRLGCFWYNEKGKNLCKSFGGTEYDSRTFLVQ